MDYNVFPTEIELNQSAQSKTSIVADTEARKKINEYLEAGVELIPNLDIKCKHIYTVTGVGAVFNGNYYIKSLTTTLNSDGIEMSGEMAKLEETNFFQTNDIYDNRPDKAPAPPPPPAKPSTNNNNGYIPINRMGRVTANSGLNARQGTPFGLKVNSQGYVVGSTASAPSCGLMKKGYQVKVKGEKDGWYETEYKGGSWSFKRYIQLL